MIIIANKHIGMANLFLRYQEYLINTRNCSIKTTFK
jgi:hypothetical protein